MTGGRCDRPIELSALVDYWLERDERPGDDPLEEHLLGCAQCSERLRGLVALGDGVRRLAHEGGIQVIITPSFLETASREGLRAREYRVPPGGRVDCTVTPEDDLLVGRLMGDFRGVSRLDVVVQEEGRPEHRVPDVPIRPDAGELIVAEAMPAARSWGRRRMRFRLLARDAEGERLLGEYTFDHTPTRG
jgi:hypothetical protein